MCAKVLLSKFLGKWVSDTSLNLLDIKLRRVLLSLASMEYRIIWNFHTEGRHCGFRTAIVDISDSLFTTIDRWPTAIRARSRGLLFIDLIGRLVYYYRQSCKQTTTCVSNVYRCQLLYIQWMAVSLNNNNNRTHLKRSLSLLLDGELNTDQAVEEGFKSAMSRKSRRKADKKVKESAVEESDHSNTGASMYSSQESIAQLLSLIHISEPTRPY